MRITRSQSAFTLLEVLIAATTLAVISVVIIGVMSNVLLAYGQYTQQQTLTTRSQQALQMMQADIQRASKVAILKSGETPADPGLPADDMLVLNVPHQNADGTSAYNGSVPAQLDTVIYCVQITPSTNGGLPNKTFWRFWHTNTGAFTLSSTITTPLCRTSAGGVRDLTGISFGTNGATDTSLPSVRPVSLNFWPVQMGSSAPSQPLAVRIQYVTQYDPNNGNSGTKAVQQRASTASGLRGAANLVLRTTVVRDAATANFGFSS